MHSKMSKLGRNRPAKDCQSIINLPVSAPCRQTSIRDGRRRPRSSVDLMIASVIRGLLVLIAGFGRKSYTYFHKTSTKKTPNEKFTPTFLIFKYPNTCTREKKMIPDDRDIDIDKHSIQLQPLIVNPTWSGLSDNFFSWRCSSLIIFRALRRVRGTANVDVCSLGCKLTNNHKLDPIMQFSSPTPKPRWNQETPLYCLRVPLRVHTDLQETRSEELMWREVYKSMEAEVLFTTLQPTQKKKRQ